MEPNWNQKKETLRDIMAALKRQGIKTVVHIAASVGSIEVTISLEKGKDPIETTQFHYTNIHASTAEIHRLALEQLLTKLTNPTNPQFLIPRNLCRQWIKVAEVKNPADEHYPIEVNPLICEYEDPQAARKMRDNLQSVGGPLHNSLKKALYKTADRAFATYLNDHVDKAFAESRAVSLEAQLDSIVESLINALSQVQKPISCISEEVIYRALEETASGTLTMDEALNNILNPPPFDPFDL
jgi:hypothetical protein